MDNTESKLLETYHMNKLIFAFSCLALSVQAQHPCSVSKIKNGLRTPMATASLTDLENNYDLKFYHLNINAERINKDVSGSVRCLATVKSLTLDSFGFELHSNHTIDSVILNGINTPVSRSVHEARVAFPSPITQGTLFDATVFNELMQLKGDSGAKKILNNHPEWVAAIEFPLGEIDIDTEEDYNELLRNN